MNPLLESTLSLLVPTVILIHLFWAPFTKVEESFNIQAIHDILTYGIPTKDVTLKLTENYDHVTFSGSVPRTFIGALVLAGLSKPWLGWLKTAFQAQLLARGVLGLLNVAALTYLRQAATKVYGKTAGIWFVLLQASQFHVMYYASRTLPNMYALCLSTVALASYLLVVGDLSGDARDGIHKHQRLCLYLLTLAGVIFRSELAILVGTVTLTLLLLHRSPLPQATILPGIAGLAIGLLLSVPVDSFFWRTYPKPLWPELEAFWYNTVQGKSSEWGTSPWHYYFLNAIPKLLLNPLAYMLLIPVAVVNPATRKPSAHLLLPLLAFVALYSLLPHKEWRFIIYVVPGLTAAAAAGAAWIWNRRAKNFTYRLLSLVLVGSVLASFAASFALLAISSTNYPGGEAMIRLQSIMANDTGVVRIHADNLACQTGLTRFLEHVPIETAAEDAGVLRPTSKLLVDKTDDADKLLNPAFWVAFDYALAERPEKAIGKWEVLDTVYGFGGVELVRPGRPDRDQRAEEGMVQAEDGRMGEKGLRGFWRIWHQLEMKISPITRGWWIRVKMEPKIHILKRLEM
ncbi:alpha-1,6- mannosyltransferase [Coniosporium apollinis]|uniref:Mannosyltransferase n=2 Tax=Coniosporium TaxID=2810619 RepID=A0ABQ9P5R8_9PEZI|nr:alpha-1,6- mannosyltransferase [Cladosporium sp. JES 115]KAJ9669341.1 alpha-1,6- mannosyltransferase [Coniosporium apollinis]